MLTYLEVIHGLRLFFFFFSRCRTPDAFSRAKLSINYDNLHSATNSQISIYINIYIEAVLLNHNHSDNQIRLHSCVKKVKQ